MQNAYRMLTHSRSFVLPSHKTCRAFFPQQPSFNPHETQSPEVRTPLRASAHHTRLCNRYGQRQPFFYIIPSAKSLNLAGGFCKTPFGRLVGLENGQWAGAQRNRSSATRRVEFFCLGCCQFNEFNSTTYVYRYRIHTVHVQPGHCS